MKHFALSIIAAFSLVLVASAHAEQPLRLYTSSAPPYQYQLANEVHGTTIDALRCALRETEWRPDIRMVPQRRAIHSLRKSLIDGYLAITPSSSIDRFATLSAPLALEKWYLYSEHPVDMKQARLGAIAGSNEAIWLGAHGYKPSMQVFALDQLVALIERDRIDAMMVDRRVMDAYLRQDDTPAAHHGLHRQFVRFAPLGLYLGKHFVNAHPDFLPTFNDRLDNCVTSGFQLEKNETAHIRQQAGRLLDNLAQNVNLHNAANDHDNGYTLPEILMIDQIWQDSTRNPSDEALQILSQPLSHDLEAWQSQQDSQVTEVMLMDAQGTLIAISQITSDFWQGDEDKFRKVAASPDDTLFIGPVRYDASSRHFQVVASRALRNSRSDAFIGALLLASI